jgi:hypothetical protein
MRKTISGLVAAVAVMMTVGTAPAMACYGGCAPAPVYVAPVASYSGCYSGCGGWATERLPDPVHQYYYVNQGPTYTGPGNWAPRPVYQESALPTWSGYHHRPYRYARPISNYYDGAAASPRVYGYRSSGYGYGYRYSVRPSVRYGYAPRHYGSRYGVAPRHSLRYGGPAMAPRHYGHQRGYQQMRRYN